MPSGGIDFAAMSKDVATLLLGDPNRSMSRGDKLRFGNKGSLALDINNGTWFDHGSGDGGGIIDLIIHLKEATDKREAFQWLVKNDFTTHDNNKQSYAINKTRSHRPVAAAPQTTEVKKTSKTAEMAKLIEEASEAITPETTAYKYLVARGAIPFESNPTEYVSDNVRWMPIDKAPKSLQCPRDPKNTKGDDDIAGLVVYRHIHHRTGKLCSVSVDALNNLGMRWNGKNGRFRRCYGTKQEALFISSNQTEKKEVLTLCEGETDAIALNALNIYKGTDIGTIAAVGSTSNTRWIPDALKNHPRIKSVQICFDHDRAGRLSETELRGTLLDVGIDCESVRWAKQYGYRYNDVAEAIASTFKAEREQQDG